MRSKFESVLLLCACALLLPAVHAANEAAEELDQSKRQITMMIWDDGITRSAEIKVADGEVLASDVRFFLWNGRNVSQAVHIPYGNRSDYIPWNGGSKIYLLDREYVPEDETSRPNVLAEIDIPAGVLRPYVMLIPQSGGGMPYKAIVLDDDFSAFPKNSLRMVNFTRESVGVLFAEKQYNLNPGEIRILNFDPRNSGTAKVVLAWYQENSPKPNYASRYLRLFDGARVTMFIAPRAGSADLIVSVVAEDTRHTPEISPTDPIRRQGVE